MLQEIITLIKKDIRLDFRKRFSFFSVLLYVLTTVYVAYLAFKQIDQAKVWNALFWIILIFGAIQMSIRSFASETRSRFWYTYQLVKPQSLILSKIIYNTLILLIISLLTYGLISGLMGNLIKDQAMFLAVLVIGAIGFSSILTMVAGIASHTDQNATLMAILSIPLLFPFIITLMKATEYALLGIEETGGFYDLLALLMGLNLMVIIMSYLLFPYLWRE
ncbi:MAG: heme exporter protein CcmB [Schleiferiaceae bacterium]|jgi:heme exporter protein B|nr:heme exporter protein CcmB [Schleiferiaceae bacterium]